MDKQTCIAKIAQTEDDKILFARLYDKLVGAHRKNIPGYTAFLSAREQVLLRQMLPLMELRFFGGCDDTERNICCWLPEYLDEMSLYDEDGPVSAIRAEFYAKDVLIHRDILGGLMGVGIKRETVGDIYIHQGFCDFFVLREIEPYVLDNFLSAGRTKLHLEHISLKDVKHPEITVKEIRDTVPSLRLDCIVGSCFGMSRGKVSELVAAGKVSVNDLPCTKADKQLLEDDKISARGFGKFVLKQVGGRTKKDRISIMMERYK